MHDDDYLGPKPATSHDGRTEHDPRDPDSRLHQPHKPRARKDTRRWCKGKVGREHVLEIVLQPNYGRACDAWSWGLHPWSCNHVERCATCGKILATFWGAVAAQRCPDYPGAEQVKAIIETKRREHAARVAARRTA